MSSPVLSIADLSVCFPLKGRQKGKSLLAVDRVSFDIHSGQTLGIVGESGSGKSTTALAIARLIQASGGSAILEGSDVLQLDENALHTMRQNVQFIFQDPYSSLNPRLRAKDIVREPLLHTTNTTRAEQDAMIDDLFEAVGLRPEQKLLFPHQFSGGQRQRIGIARALATKPKLIICDEPVSALDVAVQAQILNLLKRLQQRYSLTYLFISHDLGVVQHMCDSIAVMYMGQIVEFASTEALFDNPSHPYTKALLDAVPSIHHTPKMRPSTITGTLPDLTQSITQCRFAGRCPIVRPKCQQNVPTLQPLQGAHSVACFAKHE